MLALAPIRNVQRFQGSPHRSAETTPRGAPPPRPPPRRRRARVAPRGGRSRGNRWCPRSAPGRRRACGPPALQTLALGVAPLRAAARSVTISLVRRAAGEIEKELASTPAGRLAGDDDVHVRGGGVADRVHPGDLGAVVVLIAGGSAAPRIRREGRSSGRYVGFLVLTAHGERDRDRSQQQSRRQKVLRISSYHRVDRGPVPGLLRPAG